MYVTILYRHEQKPRVSKGITLEKVGIGQKTMDNQENDDATYMLSETQKTTQSRL